MEIPTGIMLGASLAPLAYRGAGCLFDIWCQSAIKDRKKLVICMPRKSGKSFLNRILTSAHPDIMLCDLDTVLMNHNEETGLKIELALRKGDTSTAKLLRFQAMRDTIEYCKKTWLVNSKRRLIFITSDYELSKELFKLSSICVCVPSLELHKKVQKQLDNEGDRMIAEQSRLDYIKNFQPEEYTVYNSFEGLAELIRSEYGMSYKA